jgi:hypothetical protein
MIVTNCSGAGGIFISLLILPLVSRLRLMEAAVSGGLDFDCNNILIYLEIK